MNITQFLQHKTDISLTEYPLDELAGILESPDTSPNFLDTLAGEVESTMDLVKRYNIANAPIDKCAIELQSIVANVLAYSSEKHDPDGRLRTLSNILNSAKVLDRINKEVFDIVKKIRARKKTV